MNGFFLLLPFFLIRFFLLSRLNKSAVQRAAHFPTMQGKEIPAYWIYQLSNVAFVVYLCVLTVPMQLSLITLCGLILYVLGLLLCTCTIVNFASFTESGFHSTGIYRYSRNPMYVSYFILFLGCAFLTRSFVLCAIVLVFQVSAHWIILAEERWCLTTFGKDYDTYRNSVRRYL